MMTISSEQQAVDAVDAYMARPRSRVGLRVPDWAITTVSLIAVLGIWQAVGPWINPLFASYPSEILAAGRKMAMSGQLSKALWSSMQPFLVGYFLAAIVGVPVGLLLGRYRVVRAAFGIYVTAGYSTPLIALVPLLMIWFGLGFMVKMVIIFLLTFFPICINTWAGVRAVPKSLVEVGTAFCASQGAIMNQIVLPAVLPYIMAGLRLGIGKAVIAMVIAEFLTAISVWAAPSSKRPTAFGRRRCWCPSSSSWFSPLC